MTNLSRSTTLEIANRAFRSGDHAEAIRYYEKVTRGPKALARQADFNLSLLARRVGTGKYLEFKRLIPRATGIYWRRLLELEVSDSYHPKVFSAVTQAEETLQKSLGRYSENSLVGSLVSVIMPAYNRASTIESSIHSVLEQTYSNFELIVCDDGSDDSTDLVVKNIPDDRIIFLRQQNSGAAGARNHALMHAQGDIISYLDTDNYWHPRYLESVVEALHASPGRSSVYTDFIDYEVRQSAPTRIRSYRRPRFNHERLLEGPFIDLNTFAHRRELYEVFGGFDERLVRRQDYDLIIKYTWLRDPLHIQLPLALYQRNEQLGQITQLKKHDMRSVDLINEKIQTYFTEGLPLRLPEGGRRKVSVIIWDHCRNHFSKPYAVAEALTEQYDVELISFDFFDEGVFRPLRDETPKFETKYFKGSDFPDFMDAFRAAAESVTGDIMYVVKPRLASFGLAMFVNYMKGTPFVLETNDLETVVNSPRAGDRHEYHSFADTDTHDPELLNPHSLRWTQLLESLVPDAPVLVTHNKGLDEHYGRSTLYMRNLKDERVYDPGQYDRKSIRESLGIAPDDRIILFGGLIRKHKGIYELVNLLEKLDDPRFKLMFVGSRETPDQKRLVDQFGDRVKVLPPQDRLGMAKINYAADLVILWLNPNVPASHYQFPYKATDAFAMRTPVISNDLSDLGDLGHQGYLELVDFDNWAGMLRAIRTMFDEPEATDQKRDAARRLYLRQFSYAAARANFRLADFRIGEHDRGVFNISRRFVKYLDKFAKTMSEDMLPSVALEIPTVSSLDDTSSATSIVDQRISIVQEDESCAAGALPDADVLVVVTAEELGSGKTAARLFASRAGHPIAVVIVLGSRDREGLRQLVQRTTAKYVVLADQYAFPCRGWLRLAYEQMDDPHHQYAPANTGQSRPYPWKYALASRGNMLHMLSSRQQHHLYAVEDSRFLIADLREIRSQGGDAPLARTDSGVQVVDASELSTDPPLLTQQICVVMPSINETRARATARFLEDNAGVAADYVVALDSKRQGFIKTLNEVARHTTAKYVVYLAEDAAPGKNWLRLAHEAIHLDGSTLLAFNCGKWHGRVAAFGMVDREWAYSIYGDQILYEEYRSHRADNEITVIARSAGLYCYCPQSVLLEDDPYKDFKTSEKQAENFVESDKQLFKARFENGFGGLVKQEDLSPLYDEYFNQRKINSRLGVINLQ